MNRIDTLDIKGRWPTFSEVRGLRFSEIPMMRSLFTGMSTRHLILSMSVDAAIRELLLSKSTDMLATPQDVEYSETSIGPMKSRGSLIISRFIDSRSGN